jgi:integrase/recombinase XerD
MAKATRYKPSTIVKSRGIEKSLSEFANDLGCPVQTILGRLARGKTIDQACFDPIAETGGANRGKRADADILVGDEIERLLNAGNKSETAVRDRALIVVAYRTGLRCSELLALMMKDLDIGNGTIRVHHGKGDKERVVALDASGWKEIAAWITLRETWFQDKPPTLAPLFCTREGTTIDSRQVRAMFSRRAKRAGLSKHVHAHGLRRTMASEMASEGIPLMDISGALGHSNVSTTNTYLKKVNPTSVLDAMRGRAWGANHLVTSPAPTSRPTVPPPTWLDDLRTAIGDRLRCFTDLRKSCDDFEAVVMLF